MIFSRSKPPSGFYVYLYLREDGTPYYVGKGKGVRAWSKNHSVNRPRDWSRIVFTHWDMTELWAFGMERWLIRLYDRKDIGTGILRNQSDGGEGASGRVVTAQTEQKISGPNPKKSLPGSLNGMFGKTHTDEVKAKLALVPIVNLKGKTYEEIYGAETAKQIKNARSKELSSYLAKNPTARLGNKNPRALIYKLTGPDGTVYIVDGSIKSFCKEHKIDVGKIIDIAKSRIPSYKNWLAEYI